MKIKITKHNYGRYDPEYGNDDNADEDECIRLAFEMLGDPEKKFAGELAKRLCSKLLEYDHITNIETVRNIFAKEIQKILEEEET